jgi:hypothetical protein
VLQARRDDKATYVDVAWQNGPTATLAALGDAVAPISLRFFGTTDWCELTFADSFSAFRAALADFIEGIRQRDVRSDPAFVLAAASVIEAGCRA